MKESRASMVAAAAAALVLGLVALGCTSDAPETDSPEAADHPERRRTTAFWEVYRSATRMRLARDFGGARSGYEEALVHRPEHEDSWYYLGNVAVELGEWEVAEQSWLNLTSINPSSSRGFSQLGHLYLCRPSIPLFDVSRAEAAFRESLRLNREETGPLLRLGEVFLLSGRIDSAAVFFDAVLGSDPGNSEAAVMRSYVEWRRGRREAAAARLMAFDGSVNDPLPDQPMGEGDTRSGAGPMLAPGAGCQLFEPFQRLLDQGNVEPGEAHAHLRRMDDRLTAVRRGKVVQVN